MTLEPLLHAKPAIQFHAYAAMAAFVLGVVQLAGSKGTTPHRLIGAVWVALMMVVGVSALSSTRSGCGGRGAPSICWRSSRW